MKSFYLVLTLFVLTLSADAQQGIEGKWLCKSEDSRGTKLDWTLAITRSEGQLSATMQGGTTDDPLSLQDVSFKDDIFTATLVINPEESVTMKLKLDGDRLEGSFDGKASGAGTYACRR